VRAENRVAVGGMPQILDGMGTGRAADPRGEARADRRHPDLVHALAARAFARHGDLRAYRGSPRVFAIPAIVRLRIAPTSFLQPEIPAGIRAEQAAQGPPESGEFRPALAADARFLSPGMRRPGLVTLQFHAHRHFGDLLQDQVNGQPRQGDGGADGNHGQ